MKLGQRNSMKLGFCLMHLQVLESFIRVSFDETPMKLNETRSPWCQALFFLRNHVHVKQKFCFAGFALFFQVQPCRSSMFTLSFRPSGARGTAGLPCLCHNFAMRRGQKGSGTDAWLRCRLMEIGGMLAVSTQRPASGSVPPLLTTSRHSPPQSTRRPRS